METSVVTVKGQIVVPAKDSQEVWNKKGNENSVY